MFWGLSPALDLQQEYLQCHEEDSDHINILLIGSCDARHVLKTISQMYKHKPRQINIFIFETCLELMARQLMLISIAFENPNNLGILEKTKLFMEIYGNSLLRPSTSRYVIYKSKQLIRMITDIGSNSEILPNVDVSNLKYRERDYIEMLLKFWQAGNKNIFNICQLWENRMRNHLGTRYDARSGVFDWDYNMRLKDIGGATISSQEYNFFRKTGMSFTWLDTEASRPNYTLSAGVIINGDNFCHRGYVGDIVTGAYIAYGLHCEDGDMMKTVNGRYTKRATDIVERNVVKMLYEIQHNKPLDVDIIKHTSNHNLGIAVVSQQDPKISSEGDNEIPFNLNTNLPPHKLNDIKISFHSSTLLNIYPNRDEFLHKFHVLFASSNSMSKLNDSIFRMMKDASIVILENEKFMLNLKKDEIKRFGDNLINIMNDANGVQMGDFDSLKCSNLKFQIKHL